MMEVADNRELLMTYTVFHIGTYLTLAAAILAAQNFGRLSHPVWRVSMVLFLIAGICGAVVASNLPEFPNWEAYAQADIGPWGMELFPYSSWATIEHIAFWIGLLIPVTLAVCAPRRYLSE